MNGWFPRIGVNGAILSGNAGIWLTDDAGSRQIDPVGIGPVWMGGTPVYNRNDGKTQVGSARVALAYNDYVGSDTDRWAGFDASGQGRVDLWRGAVLEQANPGICCPRFGGERFAYLGPYQGEQRTLVIDNTPVDVGAIFDVRLSRNGEFFVYGEATSTYGRRILNENGQVVSITDDEVPLAAFVGPNGEHWLMTGTVERGVFVRPVNSPFGYRITGDLFYPDARMIGKLLRVVGSLSDGTPRFDIWIDFTVAREDLRAMAPPDPIPPDPIPPDPPDPEPPDPQPEPEPPVSEHTKGLTMEIDGKTIRLRGAGGKVIAPDGPGTGIWGGSGNPNLAQWRGVIYVGQGATAARYRAKKLSDGSYKLTNIDSSCLLGADAGQYSTGLDRQGYHKPTGQTADEDAGSLERWHVYEGNANGAIEAQIEQTTDANHPDGAGHHQFVFPLTVEILE